MDFQFRPFDAEADVDAYSRSIAEAFATDEKRVVEWIEKCTPQNIRVVVADGKLAGTTVFAPMGQFFGGRSVPMIGVAGVSVRPEFRGKGVAKRMIASAVEEMAATGTAISALYPSTMPLYQSCGYEMAGWNLEFTFEFEHLPEARLNKLRDLGLEVVPGDKEDQPEVRELYRRIAQHQNGMLDRQDYIWQRIFEPRDKKGRLYLIREIDSRQLRAYVMISQDPRPDGWHDLNLHCVQALDADAWYAVHAFLRSYQSMARKMIVSLGCQHPLYMTLPEQRDPMALKEAWMVRILNIKAALEQRGYPAGLNAELTLEISDSLIPTNQGCFALRIQNGAAEVSELAPSSAGSKSATPPTGTLRCDIRHLVPLYCSHVSAESMAQIGRIHADEHTLATATAIFAGPMPWMPDFF